MPDVKPNEPVPPPPMDPAAALTMIAHAMNATAGNAPAVPQVAPPPSCETRPGGKFRVHGRLVDAEGIEIGEEAGKADVKAKV